MEVGRDKHATSTWKRKPIDIQHAVEIRRDERGAAVWRWETMSMRQPCRDEKGWRWRRRNYCYEAAVCRGKMMNMMQTYGDGKWVMDMVQSCGDRKWVIDMRQPCGAGKWGIDMVQSCGDGECLTWALKASTRKEPEPFTNGAQHKWLRNKCTKFLGLNTSWTSGLGTEHAAAHRQDLLPGACLRILAHPGRRSREENLERELNKMSWTSISFEPRRKRKVDVAII